MQEMGQDRNGNIELYLGLGSNLGDRKQNLAEAVEHLDRAFGVCHEALSDFIETEPWGFESDEMFLNAVVRYSLDVPRGTEPAVFARDILGICKSVEHSMGRTEEPEYGPDGQRIYRSRIIDIDILLLGNIHIDDEDLKIPHPLMLERDFVMVPLKQIMNR